ncbi:CLAVATA3/ESR (CLE)-related protein 12 [Dendrobium catenatum]|uniref:CLAVATA3/ESR (CLE)-related protein 12 n=1 Tax=Dendrobium catenatum TaxID=906689 RepID=A0A2I0VMD6_9ASPA|nr:CLAVATA3/ESR (CLE)-related protein 12 [Dendrobium catenatum]
MAREVVRMRLEAKPSSPSTGYFSQTFSKDKEEEDDLDPLYGVSKRFVPQGPNPLHN